LTVNVRLLPLCAESGSVVVFVIAGGCVVVTLVRLAMLSELLLEVSVVVVIAAAFELLVLVGRLLIVERLLAIAGGVVRMGVAELRLGGTIVFAFRGGWLADVAGIEGFVKG
jgi:hypothetical protein